MSKGKVVVIDESEISYDWSEAHSDTLELKVRGEYVCRTTFISDAATFIELSASPEDIHALIMRFGSFPIREFRLRIFGVCSEIHCHNVRKITSLPKSDGTYFMHLAAKSPEHRLPPNYD